ncbi:ATP synthase subunit I [Bacillus horti]|uniref:ATP synthase protein I n=1 Tax=Caldalkalibacillus horti TaxID=77523 RepID=A0ABT9W0T4_9BACI|nr:ATP synthase subunit I [Bacillus horti]MDQ0166470.1 ATP synthase protein I [Bacillus horti]
MNPILHKIKRMMTILISTFIASILAWFFSSFSPFFAGVALGLWMGMISSVYTAFKVYKFGEAIASGRGRAGIGTGIRIGLALLGAFIAIRFPEYINVIGYAIGLFTTQVFVLGDAIINELSEQKKGS